MSFTVAYLQYAGSGPMRHEEKLLTEGLARLDVPVRYYSLKRIQRRQLALGPGIFIAGDMDAMHGAMRQLGISIPQPDDYPTVLRGFLGRKVWASTLGEIERAMDGGSTPPVFVKPADRRKAFTGAVCYSEHDFAAWGNTSRRQRVWCSEVVTWVSEYRVYVTGHQIVAVDHYEGDNSVPLNMEAVRSAVTAYYRSGTAPTAYAIDFGVLANGETTLVEANDGYALGAYDITADQYTALLMNRWRDLLTPEARPTRPTSF
ncbi:ATP-grasp domain-containing protein [Nocardia sp. NPDC060249]|uniref:ATP-grasp domain-containing protein n=1 Tax=Nocardia sp. NPDC060249 TaxID=3347082 RepID=UPI003659EBA7